MIRTAVEAIPDILVTESAGFSARAAQMLREAGSLRLEELDRQQLLESASAAEVLWIRLRHQIDVEVMDAAPRLRIIVTPTTGLNHIDQDEAAKRGIQVLSLRGETEFLKNVRATAEHTVGLMLALLRNTPQASAHAAGGGWDRDPFRGRELYGKTAGIVGYGRLGRIVARYLQAFGMEVLASDPYRQPEEMDPGVHLVPLAELLEKADIVSLHVSLSEETIGFFGRREMEAIKPGAWFINTARGELVDESALLEALQNGRLSGAALDVLVDERSSGMGDHPLVKYAQTHPNVIVTPHIGGCTVESMENTENFMAGKLCALLKSEAR